MDLKELVKSPVDLDCMKSGGVAVYIITAPSGRYQFEIDLSDTCDSATFMTHYNKALILMR